MPAEDDAQPEAIGGTCLANAKQRQWLLGQASAEQLEFFKVTTNHLWVRQRHSHFPAGRSRLYVVWRIPNEKNLGAAC